MEKKRYAICGLSQRATSMFLKPMSSTFSERVEVVALLDPDERRFQVCCETIPQLEAAPQFKPEQFEEMIRQVNPEVLIVAGSDFTHVDYIVGGLENGLDVVVEKPMVTTATDCLRVAEAEANSPGRVLVTFNYRYIPYHRKIKELVLEGKVGRVTSVDLNWYLDTYHGSSYFMRWNRLRANSGGLSIHKCSHHFDLVNWWIDQDPEEVFAHGALNYYGPDSELNPKIEEGRHCESCDSRQECSYVSRWSTRSASIAPPDDHLTTDKLTSGIEPYTDYRKDACIFDSEIDIEDTYTATIRYSKGALLSYSVNFSLPYEGYRLAINGTKGRIETQEYHMPERVPFDIPSQTIDYIPLFGSKETIQVVKAEGGHGGGDPLLLEDIFLGPDPTRPYEILAGAQAGALAVATGEAIWRSVKEAAPISVPKLLSSENA